MVSPRVREAGWWDDRDASPGEVAETGLLEEEFAAYRNRSDYIRHYIFPGGMLASQSKFLEEAEKAGLVCTDILSFGQDYAWTLSNWLSRFEAAENEIKKLGYTDAFIRKWKFYLYFCIAGFKSGHNNVIQVELVHA